MFSYQNHDVLKPTTLDSGLNKEGLDNLLIDSQTCEPSNILASQREYKPFNKRSDDYSSEKTLSAVEDDLEKDTDQFTST